MEIRNENADRRDGSGEDGGEGDVGVCLWGGWRRLEIEQTSRIPPSAASDMVATTPIPCEEG